jgi:integrase/recombinase XerD
MKRYLEALRIKNYSERTVENRESYLELLITWCSERELNRPGEVVKPILEKYQRHLFHMRQRSGKALTFRAQHARLVPVRAFFKWLTRQNVILSNPASELELPKLGRRLPRYVLTAEEAEAVLAQADMSEPLGIRDRAILEVLYSTGIRRMEVVALRIDAVDGERGTLMVRQGKGKRDRMVPIGERAAQWVAKYMAEVRPSLVMPPDEGVLFLTTMGEELGADRVTQLVRNYVNQAEIGKRGSCHLFRHTMATLMLENGADIRYIQEMLGHSDLSTTQLYTHVSIRKLQAVHRLTHPTSVLNHKHGTEARAGQSETRPPIAEGGESAKELFSHWAEEDDEGTAKGGHD